MLQRLIHGKSFMKIKFLFSLIHVIPPSPSLTLQFRAAVVARLVLAVGAAVLHLWDADQELAVVSEDRHGQFAPALLHQVLCLQQG